MNTKIQRALLGLALFSAGETVAMELQPTKMTVWRKGESIAGEEFIAANEGIVDYLATLKRPTDPLKGIRYQCQAKTRYIRPSVIPSSATTTYASVEIRTVYELRDCVEQP